jgi:hypothetical protein
MNIRSNHRASAKLAADRLSGCPAGRQFLPGGSELPARLAVQNDFVATT